jgi:GT2 family glycosyltransferase
MLEERLGPSVPPAAALDLPLRYRIADRINDQLKRRLGVFHPMAKAITARTGRIAAMPRSVLKRWRSEGIGAAIETLRADAASKPGSLTYSEWVQRFDTLSPEDVTAIRGAATALHQKPTFTFFVDATGERAGIEALIRTLEAQLYDAWSLVLVAGSESSEASGRCRTLRLTGAKSFAQAVSDALPEIASGFVGVLSPSSRLPAHALFSLAAAAETSSGKAQVLYADDDRLDAQGVRTDPFFKPDWDPIRLRSQFYLRGLAVYASELAQRSLPLPELGPAGLAYFLALRCTKDAPEGAVHHVPFVLHHWAGVDLPSDEEALTALRSVYPDRRAAPGPTAGTYRSRPAESALPLTSVIIPTRNRLELVSQCVKSLYATAGKAPFEVIIVDNGSDDPECLRYFQRLQREHRARLLRDDLPFNFSRLNNLAVREAQGTVLALVNNDIQATRADWLDEMVLWAIQPEIGAVGAKLYYPDGKVQHAGVVLGVEGGGAAHRDRGAEGSSQGHQSRLFVEQSMSAVTAACLVVRRALYDEVGGFNEARLAVGFNDVDFCLKLLARGYRNVWLPEVELTHHESASRGLDETPEQQRRHGAEIEYIRQQWGAILHRDPFYNPNLGLRDTDSMSAPRARRPWRVSHATPT